MFTNNFDEAFAKALATPEPTELPVSQIKLQPTNSDSGQEPEPPAFNENLIVSFGGGPEAHQENEVPIPPPGTPGATTAVASGLVMYGNGQYVLLRGQVIPFADTDKTKFDTGICHLISIHDKIQQREETSITYADGIFGFSGRQYQTVPKLMFPSLMRKEGQNDREDTLFPVICLSAQDEDGPTAKLINPVTKRRGTFTPLNDSKLGPLCATLPQRMTPPEEERLTIGLLSKFGLCKLYLTSLLGPRQHSCHSFVEKFDPEYAEFIREPRTMEEVIKHQYAFDLVAPTYRMGTADQVRQHLNIAAEIRRSQLTSCGRLT